MPKNKPSQCFTRFHFFLALGILWVIVLTVMMVVQNTPSKVEADTTLHTYAQVSKARYASDQYITALPEPTDLDPEKVALGFKLFIDPSLSHDNSISCNTCHNLKKGGVDNLPLPVGMNKSVGRRNTPTVFNSGFNFRQFWDGRASTLEEQVDAPIHNPKEMGSNWGEVQRKLVNSSDYRNQFKKVYGAEGISPKTIRDAISTLERALVTTNSPFDRFLKRDDDALSNRQKEGYRLFKSYGCVNCHQGINVGGNMFERVGSFQNYYVTHPKSGEDLGRFEFIGTEDTRNHFKVPSLRNVALTAPYLHDGSINTLHETIVVMAQYQLGVKLLESEIAAIEDFLNSLTGETPVILKQ